MRLLKRIAGFLGFAKDDGHESREDYDDANNPNNSDDARRNRVNPDPIHAGPRRGFSVPVQVPVERPVVGPILVPCNGDGGVQGLKWYAQRLRIDEDGDVADEFVHEVPRETSHGMQDQPKSLPRFQAKCYLRPAKVRNQQVTTDGKFQHLVECQGQLQWV